MKNSDIKRAAEDLESVALPLIAGGDQEVRSFISAIQPFLNRAKRGKILTPLEWRDIPGSWYFTEGSLRKYPSLESSYSKFKLEVTGLSGLAADTAANLEDAP
jgi:hypothetical protein